MEKKGQFTLLESTEFSLWLQQQIVTRRIVTVQQHQTWLPGYKNFYGSNHFELQASMKRSHLERGFSDIAQHFSIFPDGRICTGRPLNQIPAGIKGANTGAICIENIGNFDTGGDVMTSEQSESIITTTAVLLKRFGIPANTNGIIYHHWFDLDTGMRTYGSGNTKSCPGTNFFGGNSVQSCENNFIPLIASQITSIPIDNPSDSAVRIKVGEVIVDKLNVRSGPSSEYGILESLHRAAQVNCYKISGVWWRIHPTKKRWVNSRYLTEV